LPLHDYSYLKPFDFVLMLSCGVGLDLVVESRSYHSCARGQIAEGSKPNQASVGVFGVAGVAGWLSNELLLDIS